ncbi:MAG: hypothetical protein GY851_22385, partial [bacterium]|nr:hypothetical protein [bacterium]
MRIPFCLFVILTSCAVAGQASAASEPPQAAVLGPVTGDSPGTVTTGVADQLKQAGYDVTTIGADTLCDPTKLTTDRFDLLALPDASALPVRAMGPLGTYLKQGGDLIAFRAPLWQRALIETDDGWIDRGQFQRRYADTMPDHVVCAFTADEMASWIRTCDTPANPTRVGSIAEGPAPGARALHVDMPVLSGWDTVQSPEFDTPFPEGHTLTVFAAKGGPHTTDLSIEWREKDGSRWIAVIPLTSEWRLYAVPPEAFKFWQSVPSRKGDRFRPENALRMAIGLAYTHTHTPGDDNVYWVGPIGTSKSSPFYDELLAEGEAPAMDTLYPAYKLFECTEVSHLQYRPDQAILQGTVPPTPKTILSPHPRPKGSGFDKGQQWRWMPLMEAYTDDGEWRGTPVTLTAHADGPFRGGIWASFGVQDPEWYEDAAVLDMVGKIARRMQRGCFLIDGGSDFYTYFDDQLLTLGATACNLGPDSREALSTRVVVMDRKTRKTLETLEGFIPAGPGQTAQLARQWHPGEWPEEGLLVVAQLLAGETIIDHVQHEAHVWRPKANPSYMTVENGEFMLDGKRWRAHGVNYMPSSGVGTEDWDYFEHWVGARAYDPEIIQRDLDYCKDLGLNSVSIFIHYESLESQNLLDLLRRLDVMGMKANLSLRPGTPMDFEWDKMRHLIEYYRIAEHDAVFALDLAWEPMFWDHDKRVRWDKDWEAWIVERYGSVENAEEDWAFAVPRDADGNVTNPVIPQTDEDGPWRVMTAAYRRFLDTLLYEKYSAARALVRTLDP